MVLKYVIKNYPLPTLYFGIANVVANSLVMLRYAAALQITCLHEGRRFANLYASLFKYRRPLGIAEHGR